MTAAALAAADRLYDCRECREAGLDTARYCTDPAPHPVIEIEGREYRTCPVHDVTPEALGALRLYGAYKAGHLPEAGGALDQDDRFMRQMEVIEYTVEAVRKEEQERRRRWR